MRPTVERLRELFTYNPDTGVLTWNVSRGRVAAGHVAGCKSDAYVLVGVDGRVYGAHRIAWALHHGHWPTEIDHINRNGFDNRIANLRDSSWLNQHNKKDKPRKLAPFAGVSRSGNKWKAMIRFRSRHYFLGHAVDPAVAALAYRAAWAERERVYASPDVTHEQGLRLVRTAARRAFDQSGAA